MWRYAECRGMDTGDFIGTADSFPDPHDPRLALATCAICRIREACLDYAMETSQVGIWGGTTTKQRHKLAKARKRDQPVTVKWT